MECVYLIRDDESGLHKIGMSADWERRSRELKVGVVTSLVRVIHCNDARKWERVLHVMFKHKRLPQSEWFRISADEAIPKMEWLSSRASQSLIVGNCKEAQDGHYYRRRKSSNGNWYTEQKDRYAVRQERERQVESAIRLAERSKAREARREPGYWPTREDPSNVQWAEKDPTYRSLAGCMSLVLFAFVSSGLAGFLVP